MKQKTLLWIMGIILVFTFAGIFLSDEEPTITSNVIKEDNSVELAEELIEENTITSNVVNEEVSEKNIQEETISGEILFLCVDSDGGKDYYTKGYIELGNSEKWWDECYDKQNPDYLGEYYCNSRGLVDSENIKCSYGCSDGKCNLEPLNKFLVTYIVDGDTIEIETGERVRLICIDTPETFEPGYQEAKTYLTNLILNKEVYLEKDISETDIYGRLLRYIYQDGSFVNELIVYNGYGKTYPYSPDTGKCPIIQQAEQHAKSNNLGIWAETTEEESTEESSSSSNIICSYNAYNCGDFSTCSQVMEVFNTCSGDIHDLDRDDDGIPCESLCG